MSNPAFLENMTLMHVACCMFVQISNVQTWWSTENNQPKFGTCIKGRTIALIKGKMIFFCLFVCFTKLVNV